MFDMDYTQQKLTNIDLKISERSMMARWIQETPLLTPALGFILGILIEATLPMPSLIWSFLVLLCFIMLGIYLRSKKNITLTILCVLSTVCLGAVRLHQFSRLDITDINHLVNDEPVLATIRGQVNSTPNKENTDWEFETYHQLPMSMSFYLTVQAVRAQDQWHPVSGTIRVRIAEYIELLKTGDVLQIDCWLSRLKPAPNPGQFDLAKTLAKRNIFVTAFVNSYLSLTPMSSRGNRKWKVIQHCLQERAISALDSDTLSPSAKGLLEAILLGYREDLLSETYGDFQKSGLLHLISLSGLHVGILLSMVWGLGRLMGLLKPARATLSLIVLVFFLTLVPLRAPTLRAGVIAALFCVSVYFRRHVDTINTLSLAAIILLFIRPTQLFEVGWQLSFASVLGILILTPKFNTLIRFGCPWLYENRMSLKRQLIQMPTRWVLVLIATGLGAWLGSLAIVVYHFHTITLLSWLYTVMAIPWVALILMLGFAHMMLSLMFPGVVPMILPLLEALAMGLERLVQFIVWADRTQILVGYLSLAPVFFYYLWWLAALVLKRGVYRRLCCTTIAVIFVMTVSIPLYSHLRPRHLELVCLSVGHGQALVVHLPEGETLIFDAGSLYRRNIGQQIVVPYFDYRGIHTVDSIVISHNDADHMNGVPEICHHCRVREVFASPVFIQQTSQWGGANLINDVLTQRGEVLKVLPSRIDLDPSVAIEILWPDPNNDVVNQLSDNNTSGVILIKYAHRSILIASDIEQTVQRTLIARYPNLRVDVLMAPHHGSITTLAPEFLTQLKPEIILCSCSYAAYQKKRILSETSYPEGYPVKDIARIFYTARDGAITVRIDPSGNLRVSNWLNN